METLWAMIITISGIVTPPPGSTDEERAGIVFIEITTASAMHFESEEACNAARNKLLAGGPDQLVRGLQNAKVNISNCEPVEYAVK